MSCGCSEYHDGLVDITTEEIVFHQYYFPFGSARHVPLQQIERIETRPPTLFNGKWRIWGSGDFVTWFPFDGGRPSRDLIFIAHLKNKYRKIGFTVKHSKEAVELLGRHGVPIQP